MHHQPPERSFHRPALALRLEPTLLRVLLPKTSSAQVRRRARTRGGCRRGGRVFVCRGGPSCPGRRQVWATETAGVRSRSLGVGGVRCRTARTHGGRGAGAAGSRSTSGPVAHGGRSVS